MKDGYYWAKMRIEGETDWEPVLLNKEDAYIIGTGFVFPARDFEFGDKIEIPGKYV